MSIKTRQVQILALFALFVCMGAAYSQTGDEGNTTVLDMHKHRIRVTITANAPKVEFDKTMLLIIKVSAPSEIDVFMPEIHDRLEGFSVSGMFDQNPAAEEGKAILERHVRITPSLSPKYRLAPMAVQYVDRSKNPAIRGWFHTTPVVFETEYPINLKPPDDITAIMNPKWVPPSTITILKWFALAMLAAGGLFLLWFLLKKVHRQIQLARMSPRERALQELDDLLSKDYIVRDLVKQFYLELTMIVRCYIERQHGIRAPEQTTREFLESVSEDTRFSAEIVEKLKAFLEAADLVKFAAYRPAREKVDQATGTASDYIKNDAGEREGRK